MRRIRVMEARCKCSLELSDLYYISYDLSPQLIFLSDVAKLLAYGRRAQYLVLAARKCGAGPCGSGPARAASQT